MRGRLGPAALAALIVLPGAAALGAAGSDARAAGGSVAPAEAASAPRADRAAYLDGPPPGHTGGFDEPTCRACHFDRELDPEPGEVRLEGVPARYAADSVYTVTVVLVSGETGRAGFQLAARWRGGDRAGCDAGRLEAPGERTRAVRVEREGASGTSAARASGRRRPGAGAASHGPAAGGGESRSGCDVTYVQHTSDGTRPDRAEGARWRVRWRAPGAAGPVVFHVAANAANDDASEFGDRIYAAEAVTRPATR